MSKGPISYHCKEEEIKGGIGNDKGRKCVNLNRWTDTKHKPNIEVKPNHFFQRFSSLLCLSFELYLPTWASLKNLIFIFFFFYLVKRQWVERVKTRLRTIHVEICRRWETQFNICCIVSWSLKKSKFKKIYK